MSLIGDSFLDLCIVCEVRRLISVDKHKNRPLAIEKLGIYLPPLLVKYEKDCNDK